MKKAKQFFKAKLWLAVSLLLFGGVALNVQADDVCISEGFERVQGGTSCSGVGAGELRQNSNTPCTEKGTTLTLEDGLVWTATADGAFSYYTTSGNFYSGSKGLFIRRTFGLIFPAVDKPQTLTFYAKSAGTTVSDRGFKVTVNGANVPMYIGESPTAAATTASGYIIASSWSKITVPINSNANGVEIRIITGGSSESDTYIDDIEVTCPPSCSASATASLVDAGPIDKYTNDPNFTNALMTNNTSPQVWSSSNTAVAGINALTGEVTIGGAGTTTIRVTQVADGTRCGVDLSYTLNVAESLCTGTTLGVSATQTPSNATENSFRATWAAVANAVKYTVKVYQGANPTPVQTQTVLSTETSIVINGLLASTTYAFTVTAIGDGTTYCNGTESAKSASVSTKAPPGPMDCGSGMLPLYYTDFSDWVSTSDPGGSGNSVTITSGGGAGFTLQGGVSANTSGISFGSSNRTVTFPSYKFIAGATVSIMVSCTSNSRTLTITPTPASWSRTSPAGDANGTGGTATLGNSSAGMNIVTFTFPTSFTGNQVITITPSFSSTSIIKGISVCNSVGTDPYLTCNNYKNILTNPTAEGYRLSGDLDGAAWSGTAVNAIPNIQLWNSTNPVTIEIKGTDKDRFSFSNTGVAVLTTTVSNLDAMAGADIPNIYFTPNTTAEGVGIKSAYLEMTVDGLTYQVALTGATPRSPYIVADKQQFDFVTDKVITATPTQRLIITGLNTTRGATLSVIVRDGVGNGSFTLSTTSISAEDLVSGFPLDISFMGLIYDSQVTATLVITSTEAGNSPLEIELIGRTTALPSSGGSNIDLNPGLPTIPMTPCQ